MEYFTPTESASAGENRERMSREETTGTKFPTDQEPGTVFWSPSAAGVVRSAGAPRILSGFLGDPLTTTPDAGAAPTARNHNFNPFARPTLRAHSLLITRTDPNPAIVDL